MKDNAVALIRQDMALGQLVPIHGFGPTPRAIEYSLEPGHAASFSTATKRLKAGGWPCQRIGHQNRGSSTSGYFWLPSLCLKQRRRDLSGMTNHEQQVECIRP